MNTIIYLFQYTFVQDQMGKPAKFEYKTYVVVEEEKVCLPEEIWSSKLASRLIAVTKFITKYPHIDLSTVDISIFRGDIIDSCELAK